MERVYNINNSTLRVVFGDILNSDKEELAISGDEQIALCTTRDSFLDCKTGTYHIH